MDYGSGPYTVTFFAGESSTLFEVPINDDNIFEASETFSITIDQSSLPNRRILVASSPLTTTILDDDCKWTDINCVMDTIVSFYIAPTVSFSHSIYRFNEGDGPAQPVLVLSNPSSTDITVQVSDTGVTAMSK